LQNASRAKANYFFFAFAFGFAAAFFGFAAFFAALGAIFIGTPQQSGAHFLPPPNALTSTTCPHF
jgi:hypothetical protein